MDGVEIPGRERLLPRISVVMCGVLLSDLTLDKVFFFFKKRINGPLDKDFYHQYSYKHMDGKWKNWPLQENVDNLQGNPDLGPP